MSVDFDIIWGLKKKITHLNCWLQQYLIGIIDRTPYNKRKCIKYSCITQHLQHFLSNTHYLTVKPNNVMKKNYGNKILIVRVWHYGFWGILFVSIIIIAKNCYTLIHTIMRVMWTPAQTLAESHTRIVLYALSDCILHFEHSRTKTVV